MKHRFEIKIHTSTFLFFVRITVVLFSMKLVFLFLPLLFNFSFPLFVISVIIEIIVIGCLFIFRATDYYTIIDTEVKHKRGVFFTNEDDFNLKSIDNVSFSQSFFGRIFNYGIISINFGSKKYQIRDISNPKHFSSILIESGKNSA